MGRFTNNIKKKETMANNTGSQINAQSSLKFTLEWAKTRNKSLSLKDTVAITNVIMDFVENGYSKQIGERLENIDNYLDETY